MQYLRVNLHTEGFQSNFQFFSLETEPIIAENEREKLILTN